MMMAWARVRWIVPCSAPAALMAASTILEYCGILAAARIRDGLVVASLVVTIYDDVTIGIFDFQVFIQVPLFLDVAK